MVICSLDQICCMWEKLSVKVVRENLGGFWVMQGMIF